jgi:hypothetical protein
MTKNPPNKRFRPTAERAKRAAYARAVVPLIVQNVSQETEFSYL